MSLQHSPRLSTTGSTCIAGASNFLGNSSEAIPSISLGAPLHVAGTGSHEEALTTPQNHYEYTVSEHKRWQHFYVLPVLLLEFLALALTRAVLPSILLKHYGNSVYLVLGCADCVRGLLAFVACPLFGKLSDVVGRRACLFVTVFGTCAPVCSLALFSWDTGSNKDAYQLLQGSVEQESELNNTSIQVPEEDSSTGTFFHTLGNDKEDPTKGLHTVQQSAITTFVILLSLSGIFSSTFTLVFAYISDTVRHQDERISAYGLALATFGLSFTIGPMAGGYLARTNTHAVFVCSLLLTIVDLFYIYFILPESREGAEKGTLVSSATSLISMDHKFSWSPMETLRVIIVDPFLRRVGEVAFLYYTGLWAIISTLSVYAVKRFHMGPEQLGELMSALGLCTMVAEAVLVRILVPMLGEKQAVKVGLIAFVLQCIMLGFAYEGWHLFLCAICSLLANLVYPSLSSLVSGSVEPDAVGEALGAVNGVKALTEGIGPLVFGSLMTLSERSVLPGWPYLIAAFLAYFAYKCADGLPDPEDDDYIHELDKKNKHGGILLQHFITTSPSKKATSKSLYRHDRDELEDQGLLSDIDESEDGSVKNTENGGAEDVTRLPVTFASLVNLPPP